MPNTWKALAATLLVALTLPTLARAAAEPVRFSPGEIRADFDELYATLKLAHYDLFARRSQPEYDRLYIEMRKSFREPMTEKALRLAFQRFVAYGNVAHAQVPSPFTAFRDHVADGGKLLPFSARVVDGRVFVTGSGSTALPDGSELLAVDGKPARDWLNGFTAYISADYPAFAYGLLEFQLEALAWLLEPHKQSVTLTAQTPDGERTLELAYRTIEDIRAARREMAGAGHGTDFQAREFHLVDDDIAYLRPGPFYNTGEGRTWDTTAFVEFIDNAFRQMLEAGSRALVLDLRGNPGGDKSFSDPLIAWFADEPFQFYSRFAFKVSEPTRAAILSRSEQYADLPAEMRDLMQEMARLVRVRDNGDIVELDIGKAMPRAKPRFEGRVYALIDRHSYSNTTAVAATLKDYGFATLLGEATNDLPSSYGAAESFTLTNSGIDVHYPKSWFVRPSGKVELRGVQPDVPLASPLVVTGQDEVLNAALDYIRNSTTH